MRNLTYQSDLKQFYVKRHNLASDNFNFRKNKVSVNLSLPFRADREKIEDFVYKGFVKHYQANIQHFLPNLVSIAKGNQIKSVLGYRSANLQTLFIEQYLDRPIESFFKSEPIERNQIGEFGNLLGTHPALTLQLFIITFLALSQTGIKKLVFCATPQVQTMFANFCVTTEHLGFAIPEKIGAQILHWGSYYDTKPELLAIDVNQVMTVIESSNHLSLMANKYAKEINHLANNLIQ